jgi:hypothetical protein
MIKTQTKEKTYNHCIRFDFLAMVPTKITLCWNVTPCMKPVTRMIEAASSCRKTDTSYQTTLHHIPQDSNFKTIRHAVAVSHPTTALQKTLRTNWLNHDDLNGMNKLYLACQCSQSALILKYRRKNNRYGEVHR